MGPLVGPKVEFFAAGQPKPKGTLVIGKKKDGKLYLRSIDKGHKHWAGVVAYAARKAAKKRFFKGSVRVHLWFYFVRPAADYGTGKNAKVLRRNAPSFPRSKTKQGDVDKLARLVLDALTGVLYDDDSQVSSLRVHKQWGDEAGVAGRVYEEPGG